MKPHKLLEDIGLSSNEARVYLVLLKYKKATVSKIAEEAHINRTTAYDILNYLNEKGLVLKYIENKKAGFTIDSPKRLKQWIKEEERNATNRKDLLNDNFEEIDFLFKATGEAPRIRYFEGNNQIEDFFNDSLLSNPKETIGYAASRLIISKLKQNVLDEKYIRWYARERAKRGIAGRFIVQTADKEDVKSYFDKYYGKYLAKDPKIIQGKVLPTKEEKHFLNETTIYGNKLAISHLGEDFFGIIIESEDVANTQRIVFNSLWQMLKEKI